MHQMAWSTVDEVIAQYTTRVVSSCRSCSCTYGERCNVSLGRRVVGRLARREVVEVVSADVVSEQSIDSLMNLLVEAPILWCLQSRHDLGLGVERQRVAHGLTTLIGDRFVGLSTRVDDLALVGPHQSRSERIHWHRVLVRAAVACFLGVERACCSTISCGCSPERRVSEHRHDVIQQRWHGIPNTRMSSGRCEFTRSIKPGGSMIKY